jgi:hypothetical protein
MMHHSFFIRKNHIFCFPNMERPVTVMVLQTRAEKLNWTGTSYDSYYDTPRYNNEECR